MAVSIRHIAYLGIPFTFSSESILKLELKESNTLLKINSYFILNIHNLLLLF